MQKHTQKTILLAFVLLVVMGLLGQYDMAEEERQQAQYCQMVKLYKDTNGRAGWPAYEGDEMCKGEKNAN